MATIEVTQAAFAGFGLLRRKPWAPLVWSAVYVVVIVGVILLLGTAFITGVARLTALGAKSSPADFLALLGGLVGGYFLMLTAFWVIGAVINMAVVRAVMEPESAAFAYMRLGAAELWLMLANFVLFIMYTILSTAMAIPVAILAAMATLASREAGPIVTIAMQLVTWGVTIWLGLRFCMVPPMIFAERRFRLFESWTMTRGHVWRLFGVGVLVVIVTIAVYIVLAALGIAAAFPMAQSLRGIASAENFFSQSPQAIWNELAPFLALYAVLGLFASTILLPVFFAPWPEAYRQLTRGDLAATFS